MRQPYYLHIYGSLLQLRTAAEFLVTEQISFRYSRKGKFISVLNRNECVIRSVEHEMAINHIYCKRKELPS